MINGAQMWIHSTGLAQPVDMFTKGVQLRTHLQQIERENQAQAFNQTMEILKQADRRKEAAIDANQRQQQIDLQIKAADERSRIANENLRIRQQAMTARSGGGGSSSGSSYMSAEDSPDPAPSAASVPNVAATPTPSEAAPNFMASAPASDAISPFDLSGAGQPEGLPMQKVPSVDSVIDQNPMMKAPADSSLIGGSIFQPIRKGNTEYAVINGVQSSRTISKTGSQSKWTALPGVKLAGAPDEEDPTAGIFVNADGIPVKKVGGAEMPVEAVTQRSKAGSVTLRQPKKIDAAKVQLNEDGSGTFTDDSGQTIPVRAKGVSLRDGKWSVQYEVPGAEPVQASLDEKMQSQVDALKKLGLPVKSASFNSKGDIQLRGSAPAEEKPEPDTIGAITKSWPAKSKVWRDELIDTVIAPSPEKKASVILNKAPSEVQPADMQKLTAEQWSRGYQLAREGAASLLANHIEKIEGVPAAKVRSMLLDAAPKEKPRAQAPADPEALPPPDPRLGLAAPPVASEPPTTAPQKNKAASFLDRITGKKQ